MGDYLRWRKKKKKKMTKGGFHQFLLRVSKAEGEKGYVFLFHMSCPMTCNRKEEKGTYVRYFNHKKQDRFETHRSYDTKCNVMAPEQVPLPHTASVHTVRRSRFFELGSWLGNPCKSASVAGFYLGIPT